MQILRFHMVSFLTIFHCAVLDVFPEQISSRKKLLVITLNRDKRATAIVVVIYLVSILHVASYYIK